MEQILALPKIIKYKIYVYFFFLIKPDVVKNVKDKYFQKQNIFFFFEMESIRVFNFWLYFLVLQNSFLSGHILRQLRLGVLALDLVFLWGELHVVSLDFQQNYINVQQLHLLAPHW